MKLVTDECFFSPSLWKTIYYFTRPYKEKHKAVPVCWFVYPIFINSSVASCCPCTGVIPLPRSACTHLVAPAFPLQKEPAAARLVFRTSFRDLFPRTFYLFFMTTLIIAKRGGEGTEAPPSPPPGGALLPRRCQGRSGLQSRPGLPFPSAALPGCPHRRPSALAPPPAPTARGHAGLPRAGPLHRAAAGSARRPRLLPLLRWAPPQCARRCGE